MGMMQGESKEMNYRREWHRSAVSGKSSGERTGEMDQLDIRLLCRKFDPQPSWKMLGVACTLVIPVLGN